MLASHVSSSISDKLIILAIQLITFMTIWTFVPPTGPAIFTAGLQYQSILMKPWWFSEHLNRELVPRAE